MSRLLPLLALAVAWSAAGCATSGATMGRAVVTRVQLPAAPARALRAFLDADDLAGWWQVSRSSVEPEVGGVWAVAWDRYGEDRTSHVWTGVIREIEPCRLVIGHVVMAEPDRPLFAPLEVEVTAETAADGCVLTVVHRSYRSGPDWDWMHGTVIAGWQQVLEDLRVWLAAG